jgi:PKD repeat protein
MRIRCSIKRKTGFAAAALLFILHGMVFPQGDYICDFWDDATYEGRAVTSSDVITAYDPGGQLCGTAYYVSGGKYAIHVNGDDPGTPGDEGALTNDRIVFKINGKTATVKNGSNVWTYKGSYECDIEVPLDPTPKANPGGPYSGNEGQSIQFDGSASQNAVSYAWNFGDGQTGSGSKPVHAYADEKTSYTVSLTITNGLGQTDTKTTTATIANVAPTASAGGNKSGDEGQSISFSGSATDPGVNDVLTYSWNYGDGQTGTGKNVSHAYTDNGIYNVVLTVSDGDGGQDTDAVTATIANVAPTAQAGGPYSGIVGQSTAFHGTAADPGSADALTYQWDLDNDGQYDDATGQNASKTFASTGNYTIGLKVTDDDGGSDTDPATVVITEGIQVTVATSPSGKQVKIDGTAYTAPKVMVWPAGSQHSIEAPSPQSGTTGTRYEFASWSNGQPRVHTYTVPTINSTLTATFNTQYQLTVTSARGNPSGAGWYNAGSKATVSVTSPDPGGDGTRYTLINWTGSGSGSYTGTSTAFTVTMNNPITEAATWKTQYFLSTSENPDAGGNVTPAPPGAWYDSGAKATVTATVTVPYTWNGWSGDLTGKTTPTSITMNGPKTVTGNFYKDLDITVVTNPAGLAFIVDGTSYTGSHTFTWPLGSQHQLSVNDPQSGGQGIRYLFGSWSDGGQKTHSYTTPATDQTVTLNMTTQFELTVLTERGTATGAGWYNAGSQATISVDSTAGQAAGSRYFFSGWTGTGSGSYTGQDRVKNLTLGGPVTEQAAWKQQFYITLVIDPEGGGTVRPLGLQGGWADGGQTASLSAVGNSQAGYGFSSWTGAASGAQNPLALLVDGPKSLTAHFVKGRVVIDTQPTGLRVIVDGSEYTSPIVFNWQAGEKHQIQAASPLGDGVQSRYNFLSWSDGQAQAHQVTVTSASVQNFTASYSSSHYVNVESGYGNPAGEGWYVAGTQASISVDSLVDTGSGTRRRFTGWTGTGTGAVNSTARAVSFTVQGPVSELASWQTEYGLSIETDPAYAPGAVITADPPGFWYLLGRQVTVTAAILDTTYDFLGWSGAVTDTKMSVQVVMNSGLELTASFHTPNVPPLIQNLPVLEIPEDGQWSASFAWLPTVITDGNDLFEQLDIRFDGKGIIQVILDSTAQKIILKPAADWYGNTDVLIRVTDSFGVTASGSLKVKVRSMPDPPGDFSLLEPVDGLNLVSWDDDILFKWGRSPNRDEGDSIRYSFVFSPHPTLTGTGTVRVPNGQDTTISIGPQPFTDLYWAVRAEDTQGNEKWSKEIFNLRHDSAVEGHAALPEAFGLSKNYPNPFNPLTAIPYQLPEKAKVTLRILDMQGRIVRVLVEGEVQAGYHTALWDAKDASSIPAASGVYLVHFKAGSFEARNKVMLIK